MEPILAGWLSIAALLVLLALGVHIAVAMGILGFLGFIVLVGLTPALGLLRTTPFAVVNSYEFSVVPFFLLMGLFAFHGGLSKDIYSAAEKWLGQLSGGLALVTVIACGAFGAVCGSSLAAAAIFTRVSLPEMLRFNYDKRLAAGAIAAGGTLAIMIPPSGLMVLYGILTEQSIGKLLIAGILPGVLSTLMYAAMIMTICRINPKLAPLRPMAVSLGAKIRALGDVWPIPVLMVIVLGGIWFGIFTATEAGAIGSFAALLIALTQRRMSRGRFMEALHDTGRSSAMIFAVIIGAIIFSRFVAVSRLPNMIGESLVGSGADRMVILVGFMVMYIFLGMFLDAIGMVSITLPIVFPIIEMLGFNPIWFGVIIVKVVEIGVCTPPVGMNAYVVKGTAGDLLTLQDVFRGLVPFIVTDVITLSFLVAFPQISLLLPDLMIKR